MLVTLNLATKPWVDTATQVRRLRKALLGLVAAALLMMLGLHFEARIAAKAQQQKDQLSAQAAKLEQEKQTYEAELAEPQNAAVLARSQFLNQVFASKSFSWTAVMMDLENVLPAGVQVVAIEPQVMPDNSIEIRLRVNGDRDRAVELVRNLEKSKRFLTPRLTGESMQAAASRPGGLQPIGNTGPASVSFDILADYNPLPPPTPEQIEKLDSERKKSTGAPASGTSTPQHHGSIGPTATHSHKDHS